MLRRVVRIIAAASAVAAMIACGGSSSDGGTGPSPVFTSVVVGPTSPTVFVGNTVGLTATAKDQNGNTMSGLPAASWTSSDETKATIDPATGTATGIASGVTTITATIVSGGMTHAGTQQLSVSIPSSTANVTATTGQAFTPHSVTIALNSGTGAVTWTFQSLAHTVAFDSEPTGATVADIPLSSNETVTRNFTVPGTYEYHCTVHSNMSGTVVVQ